MVIPPVCCQLKRYFHRSNGACFRILVLKKVHCNIIEYATVINRKFLTLWWLSRRVDDLAATTSAVIPGLERELWLNIRT